VSEIPLPALEGSNPLGYLAALGILHALAATHPAATLRWTDDLVPHAIVSGVASLDELLDLLEKDRAEWTRSALLSFAVSREPLSDVKLAGPELRQWFHFIADAGPGADADHLCAIVAENAYDNKARAKPTHLHFTAGQQQFLNMIRDLAANVGPDRLREAMQGPWRYDSTLPSLSWDSRGERIYAIRATNPSKEKRHGVPGADWLAFRGLVFYPVTRTPTGSLKTTACDTEWKNSAFRWPLWTVPATRDTLRSLVADPALVAKDARISPADLSARGIASVRQSKIRRNDQGGYGSFSAAETLANSP
jgi:hypothetical protein